MKNCLGIGGRVADRRKKVSDRQRLGSPEGPTRRQQRDAIPPAASTLPQGDWFQWGYLIAKLDETRKRLAKHGYEADARECERLLQEIRALDPGFEEAT